MNRFGQLITALAPGLAARYWASRIRADQLLNGFRGYEAAKYSPQHPRRGVIQSADAAVQPAATVLRNHARWLDENNDLAIGVLDTLVNKIVGTEICPTPLIRDKDGTLNADANDLVARHYKQWTASPDAVGALPMGELQRLEVRTFLRDGEAFSQHVAGRGSRYPFRNPTPYVFQLFEADMLPMQLNNPSRRIVHGVEKDRWNRAIAYHFHKSHPGDTFASNLVALNDTVAVGAGNVTHLKLSKRLDQTRGISIFHGVMRRLDDIQDYEESERIAARIQAAFTAVITKDPSMNADAAIDATATARDFAMSSGMIFDKLKPGEGIETIASNRPNTALGEFRDTQLRAVGSGTGTAFSPIANSWSGSYTAERQQAAEKQTGYDRLHQLYVAVSVSERYRRWLEMAIAYEVVKLPAGIDPETIFEAEYSRPPQVWVDQLKEVKGDREAVDAGFTSRQAVQRKRGQDPRVIEAEIAADEFEPRGQAAPGTSDRPQKDPGDDESTPGTDDDIDDDNDADSQGVIAA